MAIRKDDKAFPCCTMTTPASLGKKVGEEVMRCARLPCETLPPYQRLGVCVIIFKPLAALSLGGVAEHAAHKLMVAAATWVLRNFSTRRRTS